MSLFSRLFKKRRKSNMGVEDCLVREINSFRKNMLTIDQELDIELLLTRIEGIDELFLLKQRTCLTWIELLECCIQGGYKYFKEWIIKNILPKIIISDRDLHYSLLYAYESDDYELIDLLLPYSSVKDIVSPFELLFRDSMKQDNENVLHYVLNKCKRDNRVLNTENIIPHCIRGKNFHIARILLDYEETKVYIGV